MKIYDWESLDKPAQIQVLARPDISNTQAIKTTVSEIISQVKQRGDEAVLEYTHKFDGVKLDNLLVSETELKTAANRLDKTLKEGVHGAMNNILAFHSHQRPQDYSHENGGISLKRLFKPIERVGLYIPGGTAPLISTLLMLICPSKIAGNPVQIITTPPQKDGTIHPAILYIANLFGVQNIYKCGGAQAISALAHGTQSIPRVDKIFGPGNAFVTEAKLQVSSEPNGAKIDMLAGPSELLVIADKQANCEFVASDLLSQAEHDPISQVLCISDDINTLESVQKAVYKQIESLSRREIAQKSLSNARFILAKNIKQAVEISNIYAPEHLILNLKTPGKYVDFITNAGSVFLGAYTPESLGDYASGTNHVLPTYGSARSQSGLGVESFMKSITFQSATKNGLEKIAQTVQTLAQTEGLDAHSNAVAIRLNYDEREPLIRELKYRCKYRGNKELDIILGGFASKYIDELSLKELQLLQKFCNEDDYDIYDWITHKKPHPKQYEPIMRKIIK
jgi:histidinol dehydrogenase